MYPLSRCAGLAAAVAAASFDASSRAETISFPIESYVELGMVIDAVAPAYEELDDVKLSLAASIDYAEVIAGSVANAGTMAGVDNAATVMAEVYGVYDSLNDTLSAETLPGLANALSPIDTGPITTSLSDMLSALSTLQAQTANPIEPPTLYTYYACAVSQKARTLVETERANAIAGRASMLNALNNSLVLQQKLQLYKQQLAANGPVVSELQATLAELGSIPGAYFVVQNLLLASLTLESQMMNLSSLTAECLASLEAAQAHLTARIGESDKLIVALDWALDAQPLSSTWSTSGDVGGANAFYALSFAGTSFVHPYTEIEGSFPLGTLSVTNFITPNGGETSLDAEISINVVRVVPDPILGPIETSAWVTIPMSYFASQNDENICGVSRDSFAVPDLGINIYICETATRSFEVRGRYDSPLRVVEMIATPDETDPDPAVVNYAHTLYVDGGAGSGVHEEGSVIEIEAKIPQGYSFVRWDGDSEFVLDPLSPVTTISMPGADVLVEAVLETTPTYYELAVVGGTGSGVYEAGTEVTLAAAIEPGFAFEGWSGDIATLADPGAPVTVVRVDASLVITAQAVSVDDCPQDPAKFAAGTCGCGVPDTDGDGDGVPDCIDPTATAADLFELLEQWGPCGFSCNADLNADGWVDGADLAILLGDIGQR